MAVMEVEFQIDKFTIGDENEGSLDEPYLIPVFVAFDGRSSPSPLLASTRKVRIHAPGPAHGNLGSKADGLKENKTISIPKKTGRYATELVTLPGFLFNAANAFTFMALLIVGMEEDATSDNAAEAGRKALVKAIRRQLNEAVRSPGLSASVDSEQIGEEVTDAVVAETVSAWNFAAVSSLVKLGELVDCDDFVGGAVVGLISFGAIATAGPSGIAFSRRLEGQGEGRYTVAGTVRRTDHPVAVAALVPGRNRIVVAREDSRRFFVSEGGANRFTEPFPLGTFTSGPAVCSHPGRIDVFGRGDDRRIWQTWRTGSGSWNSWIPMANGTFRSGPAAVTRSGGRYDLFAVGDDKRIWHRRYTGQWSNWDANLDAASTGRFLSAAPAASSWGGERIDLFALGKDSHIYHTRTDGGAWDTWAKVGDGRFFSGPSAVSWGMDRIDIVALGLDRRCYHITWDNGWTNWSAIHGGTFFAGPGISSRGPNHLEVFAIGDDRMMWRCEWLPGQGWSDWKNDMGSVRFT